MRFKSGIVVSLAVAAALLRLGGAASATGAKRLRTVGLKVRVTGSATVRVTGGQSFICRAQARGFYHLRLRLPAVGSCRHTFDVRRGRRVEVRAVAATGWKLKKWSAPCEGSTKTCSLRPETRRRVAVTFLPPGARENPYPLGKAVTLQQGWRLRVNSAIFNADAEVEAVTDQHGNPINLPPPAGAQYTLVKVTVTRVGVAPRQLAEYVLEKLWTMPADGAPTYGFACTPPPLDLSAVLLVSPGQAETGNLCFEIASNDANTLMLEGQGVTAHTGQRIVWFALR